MPISGQRDSFVASLAYGLFGLAYIIWALAATSSLTSPDAASAGTTESGTTQALSNGGIDAFVFVSKLSAPALLHAGSEELTALEETDDLEDGDVFGVRHCQTAPEHDQNAPPRKMPALEPLTRFYLVPFGVLAFFGRAPPRA